MTDFPASTSSLTRQARHDEEEAEEMDDTGPRGRQPDDREPDANPLIAATRPLLLLAADRPAGAPTTVQV